MKDVLYISALLLMLVYFCSNRTGPSARQPSPTAADTVCIRDTFFIKEVVPTATDSAIVGYVVKRVPAIGNHIVDSISVIDIHVFERVPTLDSHVIEHVPAIDSACIDSVDIVLPVVRKTYQNDLYRAYISGYNPRLDSLFIAQPTSTVRIRDKPKRWSVGPYVGVDVTGRPSVGISLSYSVFRF